MGAYLLIGFLLAAPGFAGDGKGKNENADGNTDKMIESSSNNEGIRLDIALPARLPAGSPLQLTIQLLNSGKETVTGGFNGLDSVKVGLELTYKDGKAVPMTMYGKAYFRRIEEDAGSYSIVKLAPGQKRNLSVSNLGLYYDLTLPGEYILTIASSVLLGEGDAEKRLRLKTKPIRFTITLP